MSGARIAGRVLIEPALPEPHTLVTSRTAGRNRERGHFFPNPAEARTFASELAAQRGMIMVDMIGADEGDPA